jgi:hypothetical protein
MSEHLKDDKPKSSRPFGSEFLEELPPYDPSAYGGASQPTSACTGLQTGGGDDPNPETVCDPPPHP